MGLKVAPHAGAWIETRYVELAIAAAASRLMRARGLKQVVAEFVNDPGESRLMRARGLKLRLLRAD